jgi:regulator of nonsense transcripts 1
LPPHACEYCGIHDSESVVKCVSKGCNKWFCNNKGNSCKGSHIILHLVKAKHKEISLHSDNPLGVSTLECYVCGGKNIFLLGFVTLQDAQVALVCRMPCLTSNSTDLNWDPNDFSPIIAEKSFAEWLVKPSPERMQRRARPITYDQITALEEMRKNNPNVKFEDLNQIPKKKRLREVLVKYEDGYEYLDVFLPLIKAEAEHDKKIKESQTQSGVKVRWDASIKNNKKLAFFVFSSKEDFGTEFGIYSFFRDKPSPRKRIENKL